jgi:DNA polymerase III alpha subunit (gram-positive type)
MKLPNQYLALDIETGGIGSDKTLLTAYIALLDPNFDIVDDLSLNIKPDDGVYHLTAKGMEVNKINIVEHDKTAITYKQAGSVLYSFLSLSPILDNKLIPFGHGVAFDCKFLQDTIISPGSWEKFVSYRTLDTSPIARFLILTGKIPQCSGSLQSLMETLGLKIEGDFHNAKTDVLASIELMKYFRKIM